MSDVNDNMLEDLEDESIAPASKPAAPANRNFIIAIMVIGALFVLSLIGLAVYGAIILPQQTAARLEQAAIINAQNTATALAATQLAAQVIPTHTPSPTNTVAVAATATPVVVFPTATPLPTETPVLLSAEDMALTATAAALLTPVVGAVPTALPTAGFVDEVGIPGMLGMSLLLIVVIFLVRRLRFTHR
ncbi:MAG: hypothetical protein ROW39_10445 [Anaerolineaceae bacterium]|jgi:uncharacterized membrane protein (Fun14 family)